MRLRTYDRAQLASAEIEVPLDAISSLPWIEAGVAKLRQTRLGFELEIGPYAGTLKLGSKTIRIDELVPGTVAACLAMSTSGRRYAKQTSSSGRVLPPNEAVAESYVRALSGWIEGGLQKEYQPFQTTTSRPRGKILVAQTVRGPLSHGDRGTLVVRKRPLTEDTETNRALLAAGLRAQYFLEEGPALLTLRRCLIALSGATLLSNPTTDIDLRSLNPATREALSIAQSLLEGVPVVPHPNDIPAGAFSAWINVERVFEEAMLSICAEIIPHHVRAGSSTEVQLFTSLDGEPPPIRKHAEPDIVAELGGKVYILDAKYRRSGDRPADDELYQLIAHAGAFNAAGAALVAPALYGAPRISRLGRTRSGCSIDIIAVDPRETHQTRNLLASWFDSFVNEAKGV